MKQDFYYGDDEFMKVIRLKARIDNSRRNTYIDAKNASFNKAGNIIKKVNLMDTRDLEEKLGDWDMLPIWLRVVVIAALPISILIVIVLFN